jgi:hypothetical protein
MFSKATLFFAFAAVASVARAASPPGCLLGAVNTYDKPADISAVCKSKDATTKIAKYCGDDTDAALEAFADICNAKGVEVSTSVPSSTGSVKPSSTGYGMGNGTSSGVYPTGTGSGSPSGSGSGNGPSPTGPSGTSSGGPAQSTGAAGRFEVSAAALIAGLGVMAAAL